MEIDLGAGVSMALEFDPATLDLRVLGVVGISLALGIVGGAARVVRDRPMKATGKVDGTAVATTLLLAGVASQKGEKATQLGKSAVAAARVLLEPEPETSGRAGSKPEDVLATLNRIDKDLDEVRSWPRPR